MVALCPERSTQETLLAHDHECRWAIVPLHRYSNTLKNQLSDLTYITFSIGSKMHCKAHIESNCTGAWITPLGSWWF